MSDMPISAAKDFLEKHDLRQVVILCNDHENMNHIVTYGCNKENCKQAGLAGDFWKDVLGWPPEKRSKYTRQVPEEVLAALELEIKTLRGQAALIEKRNPDGSLHEIAHSMKVTAIKLQNRVLSPLTEEWKP